MDRSQFRTPFTDLFGNMFVNINGGPCEKIEMNLVDCMEVYGLPRSAEKCKQLYQDFKECNSLTKQNGRITAMLDERARQYSSGERTKEDRYAESPTFDSYDIRQE